MLGHPRDHAAHDAASARSGTSYTRGMGKAVLLVALAVPLLVSAPALAQQAPVVAPPSVGLPQTLVIPLRSGDAATDSAGLPLDIAMMPLRLSLSSDVWQQGKTLPGCTEKAEQAGNTWHFFPLQRAAAIHMIPNLTLVGFSTTACAVDANAGAGLVYTAPIRKDLWLVGGVGASFLPTTTTTYAPRPRTDARIDLVWKQSQERSFSVGVGRRGVFVGGAF